MLNQNKSKKYFKFVATVSNILTWLILKFKLGLNIQVQNGGLTRN